MTEKQIDWSWLLYRKTRLYRHLLFWIIVSLSLVAFGEIPGWLKGTNDKICFLIQLLLQFAIPAYINNYLVLPFFRNKKIIAILLFICQWVLLAQTIPILLDVFRQFFDKLFTIEHWVDWSKEHLPFKIFGYILIATIFKIGKDSFLSSKEQKEAELRHLKGQLNPHFLFNTLNNLYGLAVKKSDELPGLMLKLSELLRYSIYNTNPNFVKLEKELSYLKNYVELEKIRLNKEVDIQFNLAGSFSDYYIAPLMLIIFIENSFKHLSYKKNEKGYVLINFNIQNTMLDMIVKNSLDPILFSKTNNNSNSGIGLANLKKRLDIVYSQKYLLNVKHEPDYYEVHLKIDLCL